MNYKESYTHEITEIPDNPVINTDIIKTHSLLPSATSRIPEAVVINLSDYHIKLLEKKLIIYRKTFLSAVPVFLQKRS